MILEVTLAVILLLGIVESAILPLPMALLVAPAIYEFPDAAVWFILVLTVGSAVGSLGGNYVGRRQGVRVLRRVVSDDTFARSREVYAKHGEFGLLLAAISPIPYTPFTIVSGIYETRYRTVFLVALVGRGIKYSLEVMALVWLTSIDPTVAIASIAVAIAAGYLVWNYLLEDAIFEYLGLDAPL